MGRIAVVEAPTSEVVLCFFCAKPVKRVQERRTLEIHWEHIATPGALCADCLSCWETDIEKVLEVIAEAMEQEAFAVSPWSRMLLLQQSQLVRAEQESGLLIEGEAQLWADEMTGLACTKEGGKPCVEIC